MKTALCSLALLLIVFASGQSADAELIRPKVVVLTTFESGADTGDEAGELQLWVEREHLTKTLEIPGLLHPLRYNDQGVFAMVTGTCNRSGLALTMLGLDPRFDLSQTYWLVAGIAGTDADKASVGSAAWAQWVVDGDNVNEIDSRELPADWPYGILPYGSHRPDEAPGPRDWSQKPMAFELNPKLVAWAYAMTKDIPLPDSASAQKFRSKYVGQPNAQRPPFVLVGDTLGTARYWHGSVLNRWANRWVTMYTSGHGNFVMTECEDQSISYAMYLLGRARKVNDQRLLVLRTASNYSTPPLQGKAVVDSLLTGEYEGTPIAVESAYRVGSPIVHELVKQWPLYRDRTPER